MTLGTLTAKMGNLFSLGHFHNIANPMQKKDILLTRFGI